MFKELSYHYLPRFMLDLYFTKMRLSSHKFLVERGRLGQTEGAIQ